MTIRLKTPRLKTLPNFFRNYLIVSIICTVISGCASVESQYNNAQGENTVTAYKEFLADNPRGSYAKSAKFEIDRLKFKEAISSKDIEKLEILLNSSKHPKRAHVKEAKELLAKLKADDLIKHGTLEQYRAFYAKFDDTVAAQLLKKNYDKFYGQLALSSNQLDHYLGYIKEFPKGSYTNQARKKGEIVWWSLHSSQPNIEKLKQYLDAFIDGPHRGAVNGMLELKMWAKAEKTATDAALYLSYLEYFPAGPHNTEARDCVDWSRAEKRGHKGVESYLENRSSGRFSSRAVEIIAEGKQVDQALNQRINNAAWARLDLNKRTHRGGAYSISGSVLGPGIWLKYEGTVDAKGTARVKMVNRSKIKFSGTFYEHLDGRWSPVFKHYFKKTKTKKATTGTTPPKKSKTKSSTTST